VQPDPQSEKESGPEGRRATVRVPVQKNLVVSVNSGDIASDPETPMSQNTNPATRYDKLQQSSWNKDLTMTAIAKADESSSVTQIQRQNDGNSLDSTDPKCDFKQSFRLKPRNAHL